MDEEISAPKTCLFFLSRLSPSGDEQNAYKLNS